MVAFAQGARSQLLYKAQSNFDSVATGDFTKLRYNSHSLALNKGTVESQEIRSDREVADFRHSQMNAAGEISVDLCYADHDTMIANAMFNSWGTDSIDIGVTPSYLSMEDGQLDIAQYRMFLSMLCSSMSINVRPNQIVTASFNMVGKTQNANSGSSGGGTAVAASANNPFDSFNGSIYDNAAESGGEMLIVTGMSFQINNGVNPTFVVGQQTPQALEFGRGRVTGSVSLYYADAVWLNFHRNETEVPIILNLTDPDSNTMEFRFPRCKINTADVPVQGEGSRVISCNFVALYDDSVGSAFKITKG